MKKTKADDELTDRVFDIMKYNVDRNRKICVTPYAGQYDMPGGYVLAIQGTPPKGLLIVPYGMPMYLFVDSTGRFKAIDSIYENNTVRKFIERELKLDDGRWQYGNA